MSNKQWHKAVARDSKRLKTAQREHRSLLAHTVFLGSLSVMFVLPLLAGAYLGQWLDSLREGYRVGWSIGLSLFGLAIGIFNVYFFIRKYW